MGEIAIDSGCSPQPPPTTVFRPRTKFLFFWGLGPGGDEGHGQNEGKNQEPPGIIIGGVDGIWG